VPRDRGSHGAVRLCSDACSGPSGAVTERTEGAVSVAYVLQELLTTTDVRTRMAQLGSQSVIDSIGPAGAGFARIDALMFVKGIG
jgi:hypothetical protein